MATTIDTEKVTFNNGSVQFGSPENYLVGFAAARGYEWFNVTSSAYRLSGAVYTNTTEGSIMLAVTHTYSSENYISLRLRQPPDGGSNPIDWNFFYYGPGGLQGGAFFCMIIPPQASYQVSVFGTWQHWWELRSNQYSLFLNSG